ncbi:hypothetical protein TNCV_1071811 [Trichonephila clavipes]|nr:hypothetical protein TNCV_1071811 [Trichonephila clavipes]
MPVDAVIFGVGCLDFFCRTLPSLENLYMWIDAPSTVHIEQKNGLFPVLEREHLESHEIEIDQAREEHDEIMGIDYERESEFKRSSELEMFEMKKKFRCYIKKTPTRKTLSNNKLCTSARIYECRNILSSLANSIVLQWTPAHRGIEENERANFLEKKRMTVLQIPNNHVTFNSEKKT